MPDDAIDHPEPRWERENDGDDEVTLGAVTKKLEQKQPWARRTRDCSGAAKRCSRLLQQSRSARARVVGKLHGYPMMKKEL